MAQIPDKYFETAQIQEIFHFGTDAKKYSVKAQILVFDWAQIKYAIFWCCTYYVEQLTQGLY